MCTYMNFNLLIFIDFLYIVKQCLGFTWSFKVLGLTFSQVPSLLFVLPDASKSNYYGVKSFEVY